MTIGSGVPYNAGANVSYTKKNDTVQGNNFTGAVAIACPVGLSLGTKTAYGASAAGFLAFAAAGLKTVIKNINEARVKFK